MTEPSKQFPIRATTSGFDSVLKLGAAQRRDTGLVNSQARKLAETMHRRCRREEENRGLYDPGPLTVRWRARTGLGSGKEGDTIADVYRNLPGERLVVLGEPGSGKTMLAIRFVQEFVRHRVASDPVPVIFSLASWDPARLGLRDWLVERLLRDHTGMDAQVPGGASLAVELVEDGWILPVLDGFDEIASGLHDRALEKLSCSNLPCLLTSRLGEYENASRPLGRSAAIELTGVTAADLSAYLPGTWAPVLAEMEARPDGRLAKVLRTPLMASLARKVHSGAESPSALLDATRFPDEAATEEHLLGAFVPAAYRDHRRWETDDARRWLGHLARLGTRDLAWWELGGAMSRLRRIASVVVAVSLLTALFDWMIYLPVYSAETGLARGVRTALFEGVFMGSMVGIVFGLVYAVITVRGHVVRPSRVRLRWRGPRTGRSLLGSVTIGLTGGFGAGAGYGVATTSLRTLFGELFGAIPDEVTTADLLVMTLANSIMWGLIFAVAGGLVLGLAAAFESPLDISRAFDPVGLLAENRVTALRQAAALVPAVALAFLLSSYVVVQLIEVVVGVLDWRPLALLAIGAISGCVAALGYLVTFTAWGQWLILARFWWPMTGRMPWAMVAFLEDAYELGVLRQSGANYQFRHERLRDHLARH
ncbi:NACHT domain-containing protein [Lentzea waywayandensis]|uniref:NACHT domain-containing protein n=1 Tax=Lentzea waywayandensis TaxID=84724 RepID=UPI0015A65F42|nr:NACHT domain-containing protein [Lentzea waywayandensis]